MNHIITYTPGLTCVNDYNKNVSCMWNASNQPDNGNCTLHGTINQTVSFYSIVNITIKCDGKAFSNIMHYMPKDHIKLHPPGILNCTAGNVTWSQGTQLTLLITEYEFELQVTKPDKVCGETYKARVRMKPLLKTYHAEWSDWSPECTWVSEVGRSPNVAGREWLSPYFTPESFAASVSRDDISPVEVCPAYNTDPYFSCTTKALLYPNDKENINDCRSNGELSGFSNVGYFSEYRPGSIQIYSCPNYFTYHDHRGSSYEQLEHLEKCGHLNSQWLEPLSPDSGVGMEDREEGGHGAPPSAQLEPMWEAAATHISGRLASTTVQPSSSGYLTVKQMQSTYNKSI
uniref:Interleukin-2 receptor subunit beta N-terminal domain-containing protein n=1 Tax=Denticeps clupeoides TaxID=299321 RepID=A0AAY4APA0_9TELE